MNKRLRQSLIGFLGLAMTASTGAFAQQAPADAGYEQVTAAAALPQGELDALVAPVALYPDQLLAQVLMASTYPLEVVAAARFVQENPSLSGDALDQALQNENWDPSVISLTAYPQVLAMMNDKLDWTQRLGQAFLTDQQRVMDTVQELRSRAQAAGNLQSTPQQTVMDQGGYIDIEPAQPQYVYVPVYDPRVIYGPWLDPVYQPYYWFPPAVYGYPDLAAGYFAAIFFGPACFISHNHWGWARPNWRGRDIDIDVRNNFFANRPQYLSRWHDGRWSHGLDQRNNLGLRDGGTFGRMAHPSVATIQGRGFAPQQAAVRPAPALQGGLVHSAPQPQPFAHAALPSQPTHPSAATMQGRGFAPQQAAARPPALQGGLVHGAPQPQPFAHAALPSQPSVGQAVVQPRPVSRGVPQPPQARTLPAIQAQPYVRPTSQPQQARALPPSAPQRFAQTLPQPQPARALPTPQSQRYAYASRPPQVATFRPAVQQPTFAHAMPQPQRSIATRPAPQWQPAARPMPQRAAPQPASFSQARAPVQSGGQAPHATNSASRRPATARG